MARHRQERGRLNKTLQHLPDHYNSNIRPEPLKPTKIPPTCRHTLALDIQGPISNTTLSYCTHRLSVEIPCCCTHPHIHTHTYTRTVQCEDSSYFRQSEDHIRFRFYG